jgi:hypothetical protein
MYFSILPNVELQAFRHEYSVCIPHVFRYLTSNVSSNSMIDLSKKMIFIYSAIEVLQLIARCGFIWLDTMAGHSSHPSKR